MRWTYTFFIAIHLLLHAVAQPILSVGPDKGTLELTRREPLPAQPPPRRSTRVKKQNPDYVTSPTPAKGKRPKKPKYVKAGDLKSHNYRKIAMKDAKERKIHFDKEDEADHLFEAQTVAQHLNGPIDDKCKKALKTHLNAKENLAMLSAERNLSKGKVVGAIHRNPLKPKSQFSVSVKTHIRKHAVAIKETAKNI
ncbi:hypothetical protein BJ912DRAFT_1001480, partial [Pholiota molesta]